MSVRDPGYDPRRAARRRGAHPARSARPAWAIPLLAGVATLAVVAVALGGGFLGGGGSSPSAPTPTGRAGQTSAAAGSPSPTAPVPAATDGEPGASPSPTPSVAPTPGTADVAIVPVTNFRSGADAVDAGDLASLAQGKGPFRKLVLVERDADAILAALGLDRAGLGSRLATVGSAKKLATDLAAHRDRLAFLRADQVTPAVRALGWGTRQLFGVHRVARLADWRLRARLAAVANETAYDPHGAWTLVAGGDILLDRGVALAIRASSRGANFPFDGGTVDITGRCKDCSPMGWDLPYTRRTGNGGAVRDLVASADLAIANFENPAPNAFRFHDHGFTFTANPAYIKGLKNAGLDWVSVANNHIGNAGDAGILQTLANLDKYGIRHSGAGKDAAAAHKPALMKVGGLTVALLAYDTIAGSYKAGTSSPGTAWLTAAAVRKDVAAARRAGADVVIVFPHWGAEYDPTPFAGQQRLAHAAIDAGADMVIGNHAHWAAAMEVYEGRPIWYALGNFVFDQTWSEPTMEGITLELTFSGRTLVQARLHPHLILDRAQPNFLDPAGDGKVVLSQVFRASKGLLAW